MDTNNKKLLKITSFGLLFYLISFYLIYIVNGSFPRFYPFPLVILLSIILTLFIRIKKEKKVKLNNLRIRKTTLIVMGLYFILIIDFVNRTNSQIEGVFFYTFAGFFTVTTFHYLVGKVIGTAFIGRAWCGWGCWHAMVFELLPWYKPNNPRKEYFGAFRYLHFFLSLALVIFVWFVLDIRYELFASNQNIIWFITGNIIYYSLGIFLAFHMKDNRAFCKYACPIPVLQKIFGRFAVLKPKIEDKKCNECGICQKNCPMDIDILSYKKRGERILSTECILCGQCFDSCPKKAIDYSLGFDFGIKERIRFRR